MGQHKALFIGVNRYLDKTIHSLDNVINDVVEMSTVITSPPSNFASMDSKMIQQTLATQAIITAAVKDFFLNANDQDVLVFYWAGHGALIADEGFFIAYDSDVNHLRDTAIAMQDLRSYIEKSPAKTVIAMFDCCHSGAMMRAVNDNTQMLRGLTIQGTGKVVLAACTYMQGAYEHQHQSHGNFTAYVLDGLKGAAADAQGAIDVNQLHSFVSRKLEEDGRQIPVYYGQIQGRIILKNVSRDIQEISRVKTISLLTTTINESGNWCLLNEIPMRFVSIQEDNENIVLTLDNLTSQAVTYLKKLQQNLYFQIKMSTLTFRNYSFKIKIVTVSSAVKENVESFTVQLRRDLNTNHMMDMSVSLSGMVAVSPDEIAELRARRILLGEIKNNDYSKTEWSQLEWCIAGQGDIKIDKPPAVDHLNSYQGLKDDYWRLRRLHYIYLLVHSFTVDVITDLTLIIEGNQINHIQLEAIRSSPYTNEPTRVIKIAEDMIKNLS
ncbi:Caspase domain-containing protein [Propionispira arboris]|uniref:Caspase domain-containing protein n=1 Tax=Propionispira arboris TaxID=84035 RepID=A0A1H6XYQ8_9FIRM|nr:caspase family protein [Propionispira arboris]SEJ29980.1 Caspase domain-containing protein [Propionispira arboris]